LFKTEVKNKIFRIYFHAPIEALIWIVGLIMLTCYHPLDGQHPSICLLHGLGFEYCPGCGLGRAVSMIFHGEFSKSWHTHPLGFFALGILMYRIIQLFYDFWREIFLKKQCHGKCIETIA
jgi:hypothetical protein